MRNKIIKALGGYTAWEYAVLSCKMDAETDKAYRKGHSRGYTDCYSEIADVYQEMHDRCEELELIVKGIAEAEEISLDGIEGVREI